MRFRFSLALFFAATAIASAFDPNTVDFGRIWSYNKADHDESSFFSLSGGIRRDSNFRGEAFNPDSVPGAVATSMEIIGFDPSTAFYSADRVGPDHPADIDMLIGFWSFGTQAYNLPPNPWTNAIPNGIYWRFTHGESTGTAQAEVVAAGAVTTSPVLFTTTEIVRYDVTIENDPVAGISFEWRDPILGFQRWQYVGAAPSGLLRPSVSTHRGTGATLGLFYVRSHQVVTE